VSNLRKVDRPEGVAALAAEWYAANWQTPTARRLAGLAPFQALAGFLMAERRLPVDSNDHATMVAAGVALAKWYEGEINLSMAVSHPAVARAVRCSAGVPEEQPGALSVSVSCGPHTATINWAAQTVVFSDGSAKEIDESGATRLVVHFLRRVLKEGDLVRHAADD